MKEREPYLQAGESDDEQADATFKKQKGWEKLWKQTKKEVGGRKKPSSN